MLKLLGKKIFYNCSLKNFVYLSLSCFVDRMNLDMQALNHRKPKVAFITLASADLKFC